MKSSKNVLSIWQCVCKDMEDHANRKYRVEMQGRLNNIGQYQVWKWDKQTITRIIVNVLAKDILWLHGLGVISGP